MKGDLVWAGEAGLVFVLAVVESGTAMEPIVDLAAHRGDPADELAFLIWPNRHEIHDLSYPVGREKSGDQDIGIRKIELLLFHLAEIRPDAKVAAIVVIEEPGKDAGRIELGETKKINGTIETNQRSGI